MAPPVMAFGDEAEDDEGRRSKQPRSQGRRPRWVLVGVAGVLATVLVVQRVGRGPFYQVPSKATTTPQPSEQVGRTSASASSLGSLEAELAAAKQASSRALEGEGGFVEEEEEEASMTTSRSSPKDTKPRGTGLSLLSGGNNDYTNTPVLSKKASKKQLATEQQQREIAKALEHMLPGASAKNRAGAKAMMKTYMDALKSNDPQAMAKKKKKTVVGEDHHQDANGLSARPEAPGDERGVSLSADGESSEETDKLSSLKPMWGLQHSPTSDAVMALGFGYSRLEFARFVSTLRRTGYKGDIILATEPETRMKPGVADLLRRERVLAYGFEYECVKKKKGRRRLLMTPAGCVLTNWYAAGDERGPRPLALARYEMYRSWLLLYESTSWAIVFDFRDTFFQRDPFRLVDRDPLGDAPNLHLFAENRKVKTVGNCVFNSGWLRCWGKNVPKMYSNNSVVCSGSTMGARDALLAYTERMIREFDVMKCHMTPARTESDQGYHNYLYDSGALAALPDVRVTHHEQGYGGLVNTIGAMNGFRVPKHMKGPLDTFWKIRDKDGYLLEYDGTRSAVVHQWDRFHKELAKFIDALVRDYDANREKYQAPGAFL